MAVARLAIGGTNITDVGTDHGFLPVWLLQNGSTGAVTASDMRLRPLERAKRTASEHGLSERIRFVLADGLLFDGAEAADTVVIAGMGGETIISIIENAPWTKNGVRLILQPQTKHDELCLWLAQSGYALCGAALTEDAGRLYLALSAKGERTPGVTYAEELLLKSRNPLLPRWISRQTRYLRSALDGMERAKTPADTEGVRSALRRMEQAREETEKWPQ